MSTVDTPFNSSGTKVLLFSSDRHFFADGTTAYGDVCERHRGYAAALRRLDGAASSLRVIAPGAGRETHRFEEGMDLFPTGTSARILYGLGLLRALPSVLRGWRPDIVTAQAPWGDAILAFLVARMTGAAFIAQVHFDFYGTNVSREIRGFGLRRHLAKFLLRRADGIRTVTKSVANRLSEELGIDEHRFHVIPVPIKVDARISGQETSHDKPAHDADDQDTATILFVGRFSPAKNLPIWVDAAARIHQAFPRARFVLAGDGPEHRNILSRIEAAGLREVFDLPGDVPIDRVGEFYRRATVFMLSSDNEGFGRVLVEAMWAGLPIVSTASAGATEIVRDGETGFLAPVGDAQGLAERVLELLQNPTKSNEFARRARDAVRRKYDPANLTNEIAQCWVAVNRNSSNRTDTGS